MNCRECGRHFCIQHRFPTDHDCVPLQRAASRSRAGTNMGQQHGVRPNFGSAKQAAKERQAIMAGFAKDQQERRQQQEAARQNFGGADRTLNYKGMVLTAVQELKEDRRGGASLPAIKKYCAAELGAKVPKLVTKAVRTLSEEGKLALGASAGRFKLTRASSNFSFAKLSAARARREEEVRAYQRATEEAVRRELAESAAAAQEARERHRRDKLHTEAARDRRRRAAAEAAEAAQQAMAQERQQARREAMARLAQQEEQEHAGSSSSSSNNSSSSSSSAGPPPGDRPGGLHRAYGALHALAAIFM